MFKKILIIFIVSFFLYSCGYNPMYSNNKSDINIEILETNGDQEINNYLKKNLKKYSGNQGKKISLNIITDYSVLETSKSLTGSVTNYQLIATTKFVIKNSDINKTITIQEDIIIKNLVNNFEKRNYEKSIKRNFSNSIANKLILQLNTF